MMVRCVYLNRIRGLVKGLFGISTAFKDCRSEHGVRHTVTSFEIQI